MRPSRAVLVSLAALAVACTPSDPGNPGKTSIKIDATPATVNVGGGGYSKLTVTGSSGGHPLQDGQTITFETDVGSFDKNDSTQLTTDSTIAGSQAIAKLYAPTSPPSKCGGKYPCAAKVTAKFIDAYSNTFTQSVTVTFQTASLTTHINFSCTSRNIGTWFQGAGEFGVKCTAVAEDQNNEVVPGAQVKFLTEAGEFQPDSQATDPGTFIYDPNAGGRQPVDVDPWQGEPSWIDQSKTWGGGSTSPSNPRDGLVTLVAYVEGDPAVAGTQPTPFVDKNDDDKWEAGEDLPPGVTNFEQTQTATQYVWKQIKILWTSRLASTDPAHPLINQAGKVDGTHVTCDGTTPYTVVRGHSLNCAVTFLDRNLNAAAVNSDSDTVSFSLGGDVPDGVIIGVSATAAYNTMGLDLDDNFRFRQPVSARSFEIGATYPFAISNNRADTDLDGDKVVIVSAQIEHNIATDATGTATGDWTETLSGLQATVK